ncbi:DUF2786 domain-containing protein [Lederbergia sp. NSJ-179]|uniref:DUF2786 domain-containing protein n=1 Tax=Lederbergia sp. NSJ-179 TaxID=2931402 RepID=UPI001FD22CA0|nr:DUF2786 domain-containing protein [Lederbergia sp. NSJ-179]MCJ7840531.1 DUF2786 domain-containing protein [Lederbergia sp. NSJ-179]
MENRNDAIINKIKGLLAIANDHKNDEECQTAFIMAQKLMMKYDISLSDVEVQEDAREISEGQATAYKTLYWWERALANIIANNFRVKWYYSNKILKGENRKKRAIIFMGFQSDVELAREMYVLGYDVLTFYVRNFVDDYYEENYLTRERSFTAELKNSYTRGFLNGLEEKFEEQVNQMQQEYGLMVLVPEEVKTAYNDMFKDTKGLSWRFPPIEEVAAYQRGYQEGNEIDYTKSTLDEGLTV